SGPFRHFVLANVSRRVGLIDAWWEGQLASSLRRSIDQTFTSPVVNSSALSRVLVPDSELLPPATRTFNSNGSWRSQRKSVCEAPLRGVLISGPRTHSCVAGLKNSTVRKLVLPRK